MSECSIDARTHSGYVDEREVMDGIYLCNSLLSRYCGFDDL
jgi:hypothetical protein